MIDNDFLTDSITLFAGLWDKELPPIFLIPKQNQIQIVLNKLYNSDTYNFFKYADSTRGSLIKEIDGDYIKINGVKGTEPSLYYSFKNNNSLRQMGIVNPLIYIGFVYNTEVVKEIFFVNRYLSFPHYHNSLSPVFADDYFVVESDFYDETEIDYRENFLVNIFGFEYKKERTKEIEDNFLYSLKVDVSNFFSNIYTHHLERLGKKYNTFSSVPSENEKTYFAFLDSFSRYANTSQTKGIIPGPFSSSLCAELLMCEIDKKIVKQLIDDKNIGYLRNVDDMTFYSDSRAELSVLLNKLQVLLYSFHLSLNTNKTLIEKCAFEYEEDLKEEINKTANSFCEHNVNLDDLESLKASIAKSISNGNKVLAKSILSKIKNMLEDKYNNDLTFSIQETRNAINYFFKLALSENYLGSRCFKIIDLLLNHSSEEYAEAIIEQLSKKKEIINDFYDNSIIQIWYFYIVNKYGSISTSEEIMNFYFSKESQKNPIALLCFVKSGEELNTDLINLLKSEIGFFDERAFYTAYAPVLISIFCKDGFDYDGIMSSAPNLMKDLYQNAEVMANDTKDV